jgi:hypothetical protein
MVSMNDLPGFLKRSPAMSSVVERFSPSDGGSVRRAPVRIRDIMVGVALCALLFTLHRSMGIESLPALLIFTLGPVCGAVTQRRCAGRGIVGGMIGGMVSYIGYAVVVYLWAYLYPQPNTVDYVGPVLTLMIMASLGAVVGLAAGILVWGVSLIPGSSDKY